MNKDFFIIDKYIELKSIAKVADALMVKPDYVKRILQRNNIKRINEYQVTKEEEYKLRKRYMEE